MRYIVLLLLTLKLFGEDLLSLNKYGKELNRTIASTTGVQKRILINVYNFLQKKRVVKGSCWDYINALYRESNVSHSTIFNSKKSGPYVSLDNIRPGDWLHHINISYHNIEHSGLFIKWIDKNNSKALMLSYAGEGKNNPARLREYNISKTYQIIRAKESNMEYITIKEYAKRNKISFFNAMKLAKSGKVETITKTVDGKEQILIKSDAKIVESAKPKKVPTIEELAKEIEELKKRIKKLEAKL